MASKSAFVKVSGTWKIAASPPESSIPFLQLLPSDVVGENRYDSKQLLEIL